MKSQIHKMSLQQTLEQAQILSTALREAEMECLLTTLQQRIPQDHLDAVSAPRDFG